MPFARSILIGLVTAAALAGLTPLLCLGEWNGPINFATPLLVIAVIALVLTAVVAKPRGWFRGLVAGLGFAAPITAVCLLIPRVFLHLDQHVGELRFVGLFILAPSSFVMIIRACDNIDS